MKRNFARKSPVKGPRGVPQNVDTGNDTADSGQAAGKRDKSPFKAQKNSVAASQLPNTGDSNVLNYQEKPDDVQS